MQMKGADMEEMNKQHEFNDLLQTAPGGVVKLAFDDTLTILYATDTFYSLIKNASDKAIIKEPISLLKLVYSADVINLTQQLANQRHRKDNMININFRTLQQDGSFKWIMVTGSKTDEDYTSDFKTAPVYSCIAMDITYHMINYKKLEQANDYHRTISDLARDLFFEYVIATDTVSFTELFRELFGKEAVIPGFRKRLEKTKLIHSEELPAVIAIFNSMMSGRKQVRFEFRLISKDNIPNWYICYASIIFDENRTPYKVVGKLSTINHIDKNPEPQTPQPQMDALTDVCTKESAELLISEAAAGQKPDAVSALLLIDIRNYKSINDIRKTVSGKNILADISDRMKNYFRTSDIIGRIAISEFVVYMKDIRSERTAFDAAEQLCKMMDDSYSYAYSRNGAAASIGIAFHKGKQDYKELLANANAALIMAKKVSSSSFEAFNGTVN